MEIIKHQFVWESDASQEVFWRYRKRLATIAQTEVADMVALCDLQPSALVLDVGCGLGLHLAAFAQRGFVGTGIEIADYAVRHARQNCEAIPGCRILKLRGSEMTWDREFDLVYALEHTLGFMTTEELRRHLRGMWEAVKPGGRLLLQVPFTLEAAQSFLPVHKWEFSNGKYTLEDKCLVQGNIKREQCIIIDPAANSLEEYLEEQQYYTWGQITELLHSCGVEQVKSLRDLGGNEARNGKEAKVFVGRKG